MNAGTDLKHWTLRSAGGDLYFATSTDKFATSSVAAFMIDENGRIGVGSSSPTLGKIVVDGAQGSFLGFPAGLVISNNDDAEWGLGIYNERAQAGWSNWVANRGTFNIGNATDFFALTVSTTTGDQGIVGISDATPDAALEISASGATVPLFMVSSDDGNDGNRFIISNAGNVGIGTTSPFARLSVVGNTVLDSNLIIFGSSTASSLVLNYAAKATSTIANGVFNAFTIATSTTADPIFSIDTLSTTGKATTSISGGLSVNGGAIFYDSGANITSIERLNLGPVNFDTDAGVVSWIDMPVSTSAPNNTVMSYSAQLDGSPVLTVWGLTNHEGGIRYSRVGIGSTTAPVGTLTVFSPTATTSRDVLTVVNSASSTLFAVNDMGSTTIAGPLNVATSTATSTFTGGVQTARLDASATSTFDGLVVETGGIKLTTIVSCTQALETDSAGNIVCGTDATGGTVAGSDGQMQYNNGGSAFGGAEVYYNDGNANFGVGSSSPFARLSVKGGGTGSGVALAISDSADTQLFTILDNGKVGIGTTSPFANLSVVGTMRLKTTTNSASAFVVENAAGTSTFSISTIDDSVNIFSVASSTGTSYFEITAAGNVGIGTTTPGAKLNVIGALCVDDTSPTCANAARTDGTIYAVATAITGIDLAEQYPTEDASLTAGEIVQFDEVNEVFVKRADRPAQFLGVISTAPGVLLGGFTGATTTLQKPVALAGRVPVKVNLEGGPIVVGDRITLSSVPGVGSKAVTSAHTIGVALQNYNGSGSAEILVFIDPQYYIAPSQFFASSNGNVGIGTLSPHAALTVQGGVFASNFMSTSTLASSLGGMLTVGGALNVQATSTSLISGNLSVAGVLQSEAMNVENLVFANDFRLASGAVLGSSTPQSLTLQNQYGSTTFSIDENGNVSIGTTTQGYKVAVGGDIAATGFINVSTESSKKDIVHLDEGQTASMLETIEGVKVAQYRYKNEDGSNPLRLGLIAEEAPAEVLSVTGDGVDIYKLATFTLVGVQELAKEFRTLELRVTALEENKSLKAALDGDEYTTLFANALRSLRVKFVDGVVNMAAVIAQNLTIGTKENPTGFTIYDEVTGEPFCVKMRDGKLTPIAGECELVGDATLPADLTTPYLNLLGDSPLYIEEGHSYNDMGVATTSLAIGTTTMTYFVNDEEVDEVELDTNELGTYRIAYVITGEDGYSGTTTRTVVIREKKIVEEEEENDQPVLIDTGLPAQTGTSTPSTGTSTSTVSSGSGSSESASESSGEETEETPTESEPEAPTDTSAEGDSTPARGGGGTASGSESSSTAGDSDDAASSDSSNTSSDSGSASDGGGDSGGDSSSSSSGDSSGGSSSGGDGGSSGGE